MPTLKMPSEFIQRQKDDFFRDITSFGSLWFYLIVMLFFLFLKDYAILKKLTFGVIFIYAIVISIRSLYFKNRPEKIKYNNVIEKLDASSFPSLHSARAAFLLIAFINFFNNNLMTILLVALALIVAYSRIYLKKHDIKDASVGIVIGIVVYFIGEYLV